MLKLKTKKYLNSNNFKVGMKTRSLIVMSALFLIALSFGVLAEVEFMQGKVNNCVELQQQCSSCTSNNITRILYPNNSIALGYSVMSTTDNVNYPKWP